METREIKYINGHLYDIKTKKRIELVTGNNYVIVGNEFLNPKSEEKLFYRDTKTIIKQLLDLKSMGDIDNFGRLAKKGESLSFYINPKGMSVEHHFRVELFEDLYYKTSKKFKSKEFVMFNCCCMVVENTTNSLDMFEEITANSISELYKKTYVHYFGNVGNPSANALDRFYIGDTKINLRELYKLTKELGE